MVSGGGFENLAEIRKGMGSSTVYGLFGRAAGESLKPAKAMPAAWWAVVGAFPWGCQLAEQDDAGLGEMEP